MQLITKRGRERSCCFTPPSHSCISLGMHPHCSADAWQNKLSGVASRKSRVIVIGSGSSSHCREMLCLGYKRLPVFPSDRLGLTLLPSFRHIMLGLINKARAHILVWANQERAECCKEGGVSSRGWQRQTPSSWSVWTGTQRHTGLAAGVPDGSLESPYLQCWLLFMPCCSLPSLNPHQCPGTPKPAQQDGWRHWLRLFSF